MRKPIGSERNVKGYIYIKISEKTWILKHVHIWESHHKRKVPKGQCVKFLDNNRLNFSIENLQCMSRNELCLHSANTRITPRISRCNETKVGRYTKIKLEDGTWKLKHIHIWETHHNKKIPKGHCITFKDKDYSNFSIDNLMCVSKKDIALYNIAKVVVPTGSEHLKNDYTQIKLDDGSWKAKHIHIWEEHNKASIPHGHCIIFLDRDFTNFSPDNLVCVSREIFRSVVMCKHFTHNAEVTQAGILLAKMKFTLREKQKSFNLKPTI